MDDKFGDVCHEGPYPVMNTLRKELEIMTTTKKNIKSTTSGFPDEFWSTRKSLAIKIQQQTLLLFILIFIVNFL